MDCMPSREQKVADILRIARQKGMATMSFRQYRESGGNYSRGQIYSDGHTWGELCAKAGIQVDQRNAYVPDKSYYDNLKLFVEKEGRLPKTSERRLAGLSFSKSRWPTLNKFIDCAIDHGIIDQMFRNPSDIHPTPIKPTAPIASPQLTGSTPNQVPPIPLNTKRDKWKRTGVESFPYEPHDELGLVALFAILCSNGRLPYFILELNGGKGIDCRCWDKIGNCEVRVEFKHKLAKHSWNHSVEDVDLLVCWRSIWGDFPKKVLELSHVLK